jgi:hypothetical protein
MAKSKKGKNQDLTNEVEQTSNSPKQGGRRQFLRGAGAVGAGVIAAAATLSPLAKAQSENERLTVDVPLDAEKIQAIQKCLAKGTLRISMSKADASSTKTKTDPWLYD